ncbi:MAG: hypothetical protein ACRDJ2_03855 [Actinomycetota bacterium]
MNRPMNETWQAVLVATLGCNAVLGFGYRLYRMNKGGARADVYGQALLGVILAGLALALGLGATWPRWIALGYGLLFGVVVMPIWVLAVMIPSRPGPVDYAFTAAYWSLLFVIAVGALAV